jgi:hypothetical protein
MNVLEMPRLATMPRAYNYIRFSTPEPAGGDSLRGRFLQRDAGYLWAGKGI